jgi:hypothetical protein
VRSKETLLEKERKTEWIPKRANLEKQAQGQDQQGKVQTRPKAMQQ